VLMWVFEASGLPPPLLRTGAILGFVTSSRHNLRHTISREILRGAKPHCCLARGRSSTIYPQGRIGEVFGIKFLTIGEMFI